jgi:hypothetical protein
MENGMRPTYRLAAIAAAAIGALVPISAGSAALASGGPGGTGDRVAAYAWPGHGREAGPPGGTTLWLARYQGTGQDVGYATSAAVSPDGSMVFVAGAVTAAYDAATGGLVWAAPTGTGTNPFSNFRAAVSPDGSAVFVTGGSTGPSGALQYSTVAFDAATGAQLWAAAYHGPGVGDDRPAAIAVSRGRVFVTGQSSNTATAGIRDNAYATVAYDASTGARLWVSRYSDGNRDADASAVAVGPGGSQVYVTGGSVGPSGKYSFATVTYRATKGASVWLRRYSQDSKNAGAAAVVAGPGGSRVYVTGTTFGPGGEQNFTTAAYAASSGAVRWVAHYTGPAAGNSAVSMAISKDGSELAVTGQGTVTDGRASYATLAYRASSGTRLWVRYYGGPSNDKFGLAESVAMSPDGSTVFVTGYVNASPPTGSTTDSGTVAYSAATGATRWVRLYAGPQPGNDQGLSVVVSPGGSKVFVTGGSPGPTGTAFATLAYQSSGTQWP